MKRISFPDTLPTMKKNLRFLISAGPTREPIDPVRYISNHSSGIMGFSLAKAAINISENVTLVTGPVAIAPPKKCNVINVTTANEMRLAMLKHAKNADIIIMVAAVADYRPVSVANKKIKKTKNTLTLKLVKNPDILKELGTKKRRNQTLVGFAAETHNVLQYGQKKLVEKNLDWICINDVSRHDIGFGSPVNEIILLNRHGKKKTFAKNKKDQIAKMIIKEITRTSSSSSVKT